MLEEASARPLVFPQLLNRCLAFRPRSNVASSQNADVEAGNGTQSAAPELFVERHIDCVSGTNQEKRVAIRRHACDRLGGDIGGGARSVLDDEWVPDPLREPLPDEARDDVGTATGGVDCRRKPFAPRLSADRACAIRRQFLSIAPADDSAGMTDGGSGHAVASDQCPTWAASEANLRDHALRLRNRRRRYCLRRSCDGYDEASSSNQPNHFLSFLLYRGLLTSIGGSRQRGMPRISFLQLRRKGQRIMLLLC
jgi:hypothetical protein